MLFVCLHRHKRIRVHVNSKDSAQVSQTKTTIMATSIRTIVHTKSGAKAEVHPFGATVTSFKTAEGREMLFLSRDAKMDGSKAIRGGIPLVFPQFGQPDTAMPQHGFLRKNEWEIDESSAYDGVDDAGLSFVLKLANVRDARGGRWDAETKYDCTVVYTVKVGPKTLTTDLTIKNTGNVAFPFQTLLHTYYGVANHEALDAKSCNVVGLEGYFVVDKVSGEEYTQDDKPISIEGNVDRVYNPPAGKKSVEVTILTGSNTSAKLSASGKVDGQDVSVSAVVWNPHKEKAAAMSDFGSDQYVDMICVEPGILSDVPELEAGKECSLIQHITAQT